MVLTPERTLSQRPRLPRLRLIENRPPSLAETLAGLMDSGLVSFARWGEGDLNPWPAEPGYQTEVAGLREYGAILAEIDGGEKTVCFARFNPRVALRSVPEGGTGKRNIGLTHLIGVHDEDRGFSLLAVGYGVTEINGPPLGEDGKLRVSLGEKRSLLGRVRRVEEGRGVVNPEGAAEGFLKRIITILTKKEGRLMEGVLSAGEQEVAPSFPGLARERSMARLQARVLTDKIMPLLVELLTQECVVLE